MKTKYKILLGVVIAVLVAMIGFYIYFPIYLVGPIEPLHFSVSNDDDVNEFNITVEIFNSKNKSIFKEMYELGPKDGTSTPVITKRRGEYILKVTVDNEITFTDKIRVDYGQGFDREIGVRKDPISGEIDIATSEKVV